MVKESFSPVEARFVGHLRWSLLPTTVVIVFTGYLLLNLGCVLLMADSLILGIMATAAINLLMLFFLRPRLVVPLYILIAVPSIALPLGTTGILSRLFAGDLLIALIVVIGLLRTMTPVRAPSDVWSGEWPSESTERSNAFAPLQRPLGVLSLMVPLVAMVLVGLTSIFYSRLQPDPRVVYSFPHADVPLTVVNIMEMVMLVGLPVILVIAPGLVRTIREVKLIMHAFIGVGMLYALGTIFARPLGFLSQDMILGNLRPQVFGLTSSGLGMTLVFFACITLGQALYARGRLASFAWWLCTLILSTGVIMSFGRESWLALCLSVLVMIGFRTRNLTVLFIIAVFLLLLFVPGVLDFFNPEKVYGIDRLIMWQDALTIWQHHPYFGVGAGNYQFFDIAYGTDIGGVAHNQFLEVLAEMGVQGLLCLLWSIVAIGRFTLRRFSAATTAQGKAIALAYIGCFVELFFGGFFADSFFPSVAGAGGTAILVAESYSWLILGLMLTAPLWEKSACEQDMLEPGQTTSTLSGRQK